MNQPIKVYYMVQLAHHVYGILELFQGYGIRSDIPEMALHHIATVSAIFMSYFGNQIPGGITVLVAHNVGDIFINLGKFTRDLKLLSSRGSDLLFVTLFTSWFVPRVLLISSCVLPAAVYYRHIKAGVYPERISPLV